MRSRLVRLVFYPRKLCATWVYALLPSTNVKSTILDDSYILFTINPAGRTINVPASVNKTIIHEILENQNKFYQIVVSIISLSVTDRFFFNIVNLS